MAHQHLLSFIAFEDFTYIHDGKKILLNNYLELLDDKEDFNIVINVDESPNAKIFQAHSAILKYRSLYFCNELANIRKDENNIKKLNLKNLTIQQFEIIIKYIYGGLQELQKWCNDIVVKYPDKIFESEDFVSLQENTLVSIISRDDLQMKEVKIWNYIIKWGIAQNPGLPSDPEDWTHENFLTLKTTLRNCLPQIRYFQISGDDIADNVQPYHQILEKNLWKDITNNFMSPNRQILSKILPPHRPMSFEITTSSSSTYTAAPTYSSGTANSINSHEITAVTTFPPYSASTNFSANEDNILENMRKEARECLDEDINELKSALCENTILTSLNLKNNKLGSKKGKILADALCQNTTLTSLNLLMNYLARALCKNTSLTHLNLLNQLKANGGRALAEALYENTALTSLIANTYSSSLNISNNQLGSDGGSALAISLFKNKTQESLNLSSNEIGLEGGYALANALSGNVSLTSLDFKHNTLDQKVERGKALAISLFKNTILVSLNLNNNQLSSEGGEALMEALCNNNSLNSLNFWSNNIDIGDRSEIKKTFLAERRDVHNDGMNLHMIIDQSNIKILNTYQ
ncbi:hypothetical protein C2G38_2251527 [Gigaspora rosea]|uniref:BTB domain-containing protein n=1 Tax=Gigaspora rosea TaxID=44941 RepID=A0A397UKB0_9GLOM|nr:hypothetical protein C2G38_2251527 [Gigaspora rosea]